MKSIKIHAIRTTFYFLIVSVIKAIIHHIFLSKPPLFAGFFYIFSDFFLIEYYNFGLDSSHYYHLHELFITRSIKFVLKPADRYSSNKDKFEGYTLKFTQISGMAHFNL